MEVTFATLVSDVQNAEEIEAMLAGSRAVATGKAGQRRLAKSGSADALKVSVGVDRIQAAAASVKRVVEAVHEARKKQRPDEARDCSDEALCEMARYTDNFALKSYERFLHYVPRIVNVVRRHVPWSAMAMTGDGHGPRSCAQTCARHRLAMARPRTMVRHGGAWRSMADHGPPWPSPSSDHARAGLQAGLLGRRCPCPSRPAKFAGYSNARR